VPTRQGSRSNSGIVGIVGVEDFVDGGHHRQGRAVEVGGKRVNQVIAVRSGGQSL
jgi:hypothetical protein